MALATTVKRLGLADAFIRRNPVLYGRAARSIRALEDRADTTIPRRLEERLAATLRAAGRTAYGQKLGSPRRLDEWPILGKQLIREKPEDFICGSGLWSVGAATSGTSGTPLQLRRSLASVAYEQAVIDRCLERFGVTPSRSRGAVLRGDDIKLPSDREPPFWQLANGGRRLLFSSNHLDAGTLKAFVGALREYSPEVLFAYPTVLDSLCALMIEHGEQLKIPLTVCSSETLTQATCEAASRALGTRILDYYGQAERVAFASGNPIEGYFFHAGYSVNELHPLEADGDTIVYELIATGLANDVMPLVRYRTGDKVRLARDADPLAVARGEAPFFGIIGRSDDVLISPNGAKLTGIDHIPRGVAGVIRAQFIQESATDIRLLIIPADDFNDRSRALLMEHAALKLPPPMQVRIELTTQLERAASGKAPLVIRRI
jgi:phenylacetate-coenzyme A ligase PaaK-like adenylate-forming protein